MEKTDRKKEYLYLRGIGENSIKKRGLLSKAPTNSNN